jgi:hypothetical protein
VAASVARFPLWGHAVETGAGASVAVEPRHGKVVELVVAVDGLGDQHGETVRDQTPRDLGDGPLGMGRVVEAERRDRAHISSRVFAES